VLLQIYGLVFNCCFKDTDISLSSIATHLILVILLGPTTNFFLIPTVKKIQNRLIFDKVIGV